MATSVTVDELHLNASYGRYRGWKSAVAPAPEPPVALDEELPTATETPALGALVVQFEAQAREDLRVGFAPPRVGREPSQWAYELTIGYSGNTEVLWRKHTVRSQQEKRQEEELAHVFAGRTCSPQDFIAYWAVVQQGVLVFGLGAHVGVDTVAKCVDPAFVPVQQVALASWDTPATVRKLVITPVYSDGGTPLDVASMEPSTIVRADPSGQEDLVSAHERAEFERACDAAKRRAERFGGAYVPPTIKTFVDPKTVRRLQRTGAVEPGFTTGFDVSSQDEVGKREQRMKRFNTPEFALAYSTETVRALSDGVTQDEWQEKQREKEKRQERARKFGLSETAAADRKDLTPASDKVRQERCDVRASDSDSAMTAAAVFRDDAVHVYSLDERFQQVRTSDVLAYFVGYGPSYVEWINDSSCTVVFQDPFTAGRALVSLGEEVPLQTKPQAPAAAAAGPDDVEMDAEPSAVDVDVPDDAFNRSHWRVGRAIGSSSQPSDKTWRVLLRRATEDDFPPEKTNKRYHERGRGHAQSTHQPRGRSLRQPHDQGSSMPSRYTTSSGRSARAHPYRNSSGNQGERASGRRRRGRRDSDDDNDNDADSARDTGKPSSRIRMNADGSIDFVRSGAGDAAGGPEPESAS